MKCMHCNFSLILYIITKVREEFQSYKSETNERWTCTGWCFQAFISFAFQKQRALIQQNS